MDLCFSSLGKGKDVSLVLLLLAGRGLSLKELEGEFGQEHEVIG